MLIDTHCHLDFNAFDDDREAVLRRAWETGVTRIVIPGVDLEANRRAVALAEQEPRVFAAIGIHPNDAESWDAATLAELERLARRPKVVAVGEIGLDFYRDRARPERQQAALRQQLELAARHNLPVLIHSRESLPALLPVLLEWQAGLEQTGSPLAARPGVLHSFSGSLGDAEAAVRAHFMIGVGGPVTFRNAAEHQALIAALPLDALVLETDAPFLTPHPYRGRRNEPAYLRYTAEAVAQLHSISFSAVAESTSNNAARLFAWSSVD